MVSGETVEYETPDIERGRECLVNLMGQHFLSRILDVSEERITVSFPGVDYPASGMYLELQFHDEEGFNCYRSQVEAGPLNHPGKILIRRPNAMDRMQHRHTCRVSTDLTVQVKEEDHVRKYDAALINLSGGGALLQTDAPLDFNSNIEITLSIPRDRTRTIHGHVMHVDRPRPSHNDDRSTVGVRFVKLDPETSKAITEYVWQRLREMYPGQ